MSVSNNKNTHSWADVLTAVGRFLPRVPSFLWSNIKLKRAQKSDIGSTGFYLQQAAERFPEQVFLECDGRCYTYNQFNRWVNQIAHTLHAQGLKAGDCVALLMENRAELLACVFAANKLGAMAGMMNHKQKADVLAHSFNLIQPTMLVVGEECLAALATADGMIDDVTRFFVADPELHPTSAEIRENSSGTAAQQQSLQQSVNCPAGYLDLMSMCATAKEHNPDVTATITLGTPCFYVFTSGTTGLPKAAPMTHLRWYKAGIGFGQMAVGLKPKDRLYCCSPLYHNTALSIALSSIVMTHSCLLLGRRFSASQFWQQMCELQATAFVYIGEMCRYLLNQPTSKFDQQHAIRTTLGNGLRAEIWDDFQKRFGISRICELYGASEGNIGFVNAFNLKRTVGFSPMTYAIVKFDIDNEQVILDQKGRLIPVKKGEVGLLLAEVAEKTPFDGYANNPKANEAKLLRGVFKADDCWFNTGDLVRHQGFRHIAFVDRVGDTFRWKAENVATTEVEAQLQTFSDIVEAVVYGVKVPHAEGRAGMASLTVAADRRFNPQAFYQHVRQTLPDYAIPLFVRLRDFHEVTGTFKIKKTELKRQGFQLLTETDIVYVLLDREKGYQRISTDVIQAIEQGSVRF